MYCDKYRGGGMCAFSPEDIYAWNLAKWEAMGWGPASQQAFFVQPTEQVIGAGMCCWHEPAEMYLPIWRRRVAATSERTWSPDAGRSVEDFLKRLDATDQGFHRLVPQAVASRSITAVSHAGSSHCHVMDSAHNMQLDDPPEALDGRSRLTWWDHKGTAEWAQYDFGASETVSNVEVHWFVDGQGCRLPQSWRLLYKTEGGWQPVANPSGYGLEAGRFNTVTFDAVTTTALRLEVQLQPEHSGGILRWRVGRKKP